MNKYWFFTALLLCNWVLNGNDARCQGPTLLYAKHFGGDHAQATALGVDSMGNGIFGGQFKGSPDVDPGPGVLTFTASVNNWDGYVSKYDPAGNMIWAKHLAGNGTEYVNALATDQDGNIYLTGGFSTTLDLDPGPATVLVNGLSNSSNMYVIKLDSSGNFVWGRSLNSQSSAGCQGWDIVLDDLGNVIVVGQFGLMVDFDPGPGTFTMNGYNGNAYILKLDSSGNFVWAKKVGSNIANVASVRAVSMDKANDIVLVGKFSNTVDFDPGAGTFNLSTGLYPNAFVLKLRNSGTFSWAKQFAGPALTETWDVAIDRAGNVITTGTFEETADFDPGVGTVSLSSPNYADIFVSKLDSTGNFVWVDRFGGFYDDVMGTLDVDDLGNIYLSGTFASPMDIDPGPATNLLYAMDGADNFLMKLNPAGNLAWAGNFGSALVSDFPLWINCGPTGVVHFSGYYLGTTDFDPSGNTFNLSLTSGGLHDAIMGKVGDCVFPDLPLLDGPSAAICPGTSTTLSVVAGNLNDAAYWAWYQGSCGGNLIGSGTSITVSPSVTTTYFVRGQGTCSNGICRSITIQVGDQIAPILTAPADLTVGADQGQCFATNVSLGNPVASDNCTLATVTNNAPTTFPIGNTTVVWTATDAIGNSSTALQVITVTMSIDTSVNVQGPALVANANGVTYQWIDCISGLPIIGATNANFTPAVSGQYAVVLSLSACSDTSSCYNIVVVGAEEPFHPSMVVYPSPANYRIYVQVVADGIIELIDANGKRIYTNALAEGTTIIDLANFSAGLYAIRFQHGESLELQKLVVVKD